ncbi:MAG: uracil-DNA glycosylase [Limisphaerales bacterium]
MPPAYNELLEAVIGHLEARKAGGERHVMVSAETLARLSRPPAKEYVADNFRAPTPAIIAPAEEPGPVEPSPASAATLQTVTEGSRLPAERAAAFSALRERVLGCAKCPHLASSRKSVVFGVGNMDAQLMFVGEAPGADEDARGEPFVGRAGELLTKIIQAMGLQRGDVYIANILKCRPDTPGQTKGNRKPTPEEMATCAPYLREQIDFIRPRVIVALGVTAIEGLLGKTVAITKVRGHWSTYQGTPLMPTFHPAYLLHNQALSEKRKVWEDILAVMEKLGMPISEKQRNYFTKATS